MPGYLSHDKTTAEVKARAEELLAQMGIADVKDHLPSQVSGGEQQRCAIARSIIHDPKILFADETADNGITEVSGGQLQRACLCRALINHPKVLFADEPTGALNRKNTKEVLDLLTELNRKGQSVLMVTHDLRAALRGSRLLYLEDGNVIGEMTLPPYDKEDEKSREAQVNAWLSSMKW